MARSNRSLRTNAPRRAAPTSVLVALALAATVATGPGEAAADEKARSWFTDTILVDQTGRELRFYSDVLAGRVVVINFIYTRCEWACPIMTARLNALRSELGERFGKEVFFVSISVDPRDTPADLRAFAEKQRAAHDGWIFLTGTPESVRQVLARLGQVVEEPEAHSTILIAGNESRRHWKKLRSDLPTAALAAQLGELLGGG